MKKTGCILLCINLILSLSASVLSYGEEWNGYQSSGTVNFNDVPPGHWAHDSISEVCGKGWFNGYTDGSFRPDASITRAEALKVFVEFSGLDYMSIDASKSSFYDVDPNAWYSIYIEAGKDLFPTQTTIQGKIPFKPDLPVTREDTIYALVKTLGCDNVVKYPNQYLLNVFSDKSSISDNVEKYFAIALDPEHPLVSGFPDSTIRAQQALTRAEFAALLLRGARHGFHDREAAIKSVSIKPSGSIELEIGETTYITGKALYYDGKTSEYNNLSLCASSNNGVIRINGNGITALKEGTTVISFEDDEYLKDEIINVTVKKPSDKPTIKITDYDEYTESETAIIRGSIRDTTAYVDLKCNGKDINVVGNNFEYEAYLSVGPNQFTFDAVNEYGNESSKTITITRKEAKPTTAKMINVVGKTEDDAINELEKIGFRVEVNKIWDNNVAAGIVISQDINSGKEVMLGELVEITVSGGKNDWIGWTDELPSYVDESSYIIEEKTQYRYKKYEKKSTTGTSGMSGWDLINTEEKWSGWSGWSTNKVTASSTREVEKRDVAEPKQQKTQWNYTRYYGWNSTKGCYVSWPIKGTHSKTYQERGWSDSPLPNHGIGDGTNVYCYKDAGDSISVWWWNETTRTVDLPTTYRTEYQYRDKTVTYYYGRWTNWSEWSDTRAYEDSQTTVETKKVYRYKFR